MYLLFFFNDTATTEIYTLSLHDALPICADSLSVQNAIRKRAADADEAPAALDLVVVEGEGEILVHLAFQLKLLAGGADRKSTRLNSSHANISYAVFCLKKKKTLHFTSPA